MDIERDIEGSLERFKENQSVAKNVKFLGKILRRATMGGIYVRPDSMVERRGTCSSTNVGF